ncbi:MAG: hypothetical protein MUQ48_07925, partial [Pirellulales bacterium]|nr:hypothetical protein [Pirellulales bacterium]
NSMEQGREDVLKQLGWTREQAQAFIDRWKKMKQMQSSVDPREQEQFRQTLESLGLRPSSVRRSRDQEKDAQGGQAEGRRSRPPSEYREQFKAYTQGTADQGSEKNR